jgi:amidase
MTSGFLSEICTDIASPWRLAVKDSIDLQGRITGMGSPLLAENSPALRTAPVVERLLAAGYRVKGNTRMHALALGATGINTEMGTPTNPAFPALVPGGSSSGSAAVIADGSADLAIGTDTGGSVRVPAACCNVPGIKSTFGLISRQGVAPAASSLDAVGYFARSADVLAAAIRATGVIAVAAAAGIAESLAAALAGGPFETCALELPGMDAGFTAGFVLINAEAWQTFAAFTRRGLIAADVEERLMLGKAITAAELAEAEAARLQFRAEVDAALTTVDALVLPTLPIFPPTLERGAQAASGVELTRLVRPFNVSGHPAISIPVPSLGDGPVSMQIVGRWHADLSLCDAMARLQAHVS